MSTTKTIGGISVIASTPFRGSKDSKLLDATETMIRIDKPSWFKAGRFFYSDYRIQTMNSKYRGVAITCFLFC